MKHLVPFLWFALVLASLGIGFWGSREVHFQSHRDHVTQIFPQETLPSLRVAVVHSYHPEYPWEQGVNRGLMQAWAGLAFFSIDHIYMNTKREPAVLQMELAGRRALAKVDSLHPDLVVVSDDDAQRYFSQEFLRRSKIPLVFLGVNGVPEDYGLNQPQVTGVLEQSFLSKTLDFCQEFIRNPRRIVVLSDSSSTSLAAVKRMQAQELPFPVVRYILAKSLRDWQGAILWANQNADAVVVFTYHTLRGSQNVGPSVEPEKVIQWTNQHLTIPRLGLVGFSIDDGAACGVVESSVQQGLEAGRLAKNILEGASPHSLPWITPDQGKTWVNLNPLKKLGFAPSIGLIKAANIVKESSP